MREMPRVILWDLGGVFVRYDARGQVRAVAKLFGVREEEAWPVCGSDAQDSPSGRFSRGLYTPRNYFEELQRRFGKAPDETAFWAAHFSTIAPIWETIDFARRIREGHPEVRHAVTSDNDECRFVHSLDLVMFPFGLKFCSCMVGTLKPDPRIWSLAANMSNVLPGECLVVDDKRENVEAARHVGFEAIHFLDADRFEQTFTARYLVR